MVLAVVRKVLGALLCVVVEALDVGQHGLACVRTSLKRS